jgi:hypothetical protein
MIKTRSARKIASSISWVTNTMAAGAPFRHVEVPALVERHPDR